MIIYRRYTIRYVIMGPFGWVIYIDERLYQFGRRKNNFCNLLYLLVILLCDRYIFFVTLLNLPESSFSVAFKMFDLDNSGYVLQILWNFKQLKF